MPELYKIKMYINFNINIYSLPLYKYYFINSACVDELSASSSPGMRRGGTLTPSSTGSRNHSPRPRDTGEARLRPSRNPNRNSANLTNSTLQEDLIRLITPDVNDLTPTKVT